MEERGRQTAGGRTGRLTRFVAVMVFALGTMAVAGFFLREPQADRQQAQAAQQLKPLLLHTIAQAENAARDEIAKELAAWRSRVMARVDRDFLDWHFAYMRRRSADIKWWWQRLVSGKDVADKTYIADITTVFQQKVMAADRVQAEMEQIAARAANRYHAALLSGVQTARANSSLDRAAFDQALHHITLVQTATDDQKQIKARITLAGLVQEQDANGPLAAAFKSHLTASLLAAGQLRPRDLKALPGSAIKVAAIAMLAVKTGTNVAAAVKSLGVAEAAAGTIGAATAAVVVIAALGAHEWWMHKDYVTTQRPRLRREIEIALKSFSTEMLTEKGRFGMGLRHISHQLEASIADETVLARFKRRLPENLRRMLDI